MLNKFMAKRLAKQVSKEDLLGPLKDAWRPLITEDTSIEEQVKISMDRIKKSGMGSVFSTIGITKDDIKKVLTDIKEEKFGDNSTTSKTK